MHPLFFDYSNQKIFVENIRDFGVTSFSEAEAYLQNGPLKSYSDFGHVLNLISTREGIPIGMCGPIKRPILSDVDIGFGLMAEYTDKVLKNINSKKSWPLPILIMANR